MIKTCIFLLLSLISLGSSETLQYCSNTPIGYIGTNQCHYGQVMTPSVNKGIIQWVCIYTNRSFMGTVTGRYHRIELWHFNGTQPYSKFYEADVFVPIGVVGWWQTFVNQYWDGGTETSFTAVMQSEYTYGNPYNWSLSTIGFDGMQQYSEIIRNWQTGTNETWLVASGELGNFMFKVGFLPGDPGVAPVSLGVIKGCFR